jgi:hypothetical protein
MQYLSKQNINYISRNLKKEGICYSHLFEDLLDHICCDVELEMHKGIRFNEAYQNVKKKIGTKGLKEIQDATIYYVNLNLLVMKKLMNYLVVISTTLIACGLLFKVNHWEGANLIMFAGFALLFTLYFPVAFNHLVRETKTKILSIRFFEYFIGFIALFETGVAILFTYMHWPGGEVLVIVSWVLLLFIFFPMIIIHILRSEKQKTIPLTLAIFSYIFIAVTIAWGFNGKRDVKNLITYTADDIVQETGFYKTKSDIIYHKIQANLPDSSGSYDRFKAYEKSFKDAIQDVERCKSLLLANNSIDIYSLNRKLIKNISLHYLNYDDTKKLKDDIDEYTSQALKFCEGDENLKKLILTKLTTGAVNIEKYGYLSWEKRNFDVSPGPVLKYNNLNRIEKDLYLVHCEILENFDNKLNFDV